MWNSTRFIMRVLGLAAALWLALGGAAQAAYISIRISTQVTLDPTGGSLMPVGEAFDMEFQVDAAAPNETAVPGQYLATDPNGLILSGFYSWDLLGFISSISADAGLGTWESTGIFPGDFNPYVDLPYSLSLSGPGLTPEQLAPDFTSLAGGSLVIDVSALGEFFTLTGPDFIATPTSVEIVPIPEPATLLLVGLGMTGLAAIRHRSG